MILNPRILAAGLVVSGRYTSRALRALAESERLTRVVDLRDAAHPPLLSAVAFEGMGLRYTRVPILADDGLPVPFALDRALAAAGDRALVHCFHGLHRAGLFEALWRVRVEGWGVDRALAAWRSRVPDVDATHPHIVRTLC